MYCTAFFFFFSAKIWWKFAIDATLHFIHQRNQSYTKESLLHFAKTNTDYVEAYSTLLINGEKYTDFSRKVIKCLPTMWWSLIV